MHTSSSCTHGANDHEFTLPFIFHETSTYNSALSFTLLETDRTYDIECMCHDSVYIYQLQIATRHIHKYGLYTHTHTHTHTHIDRTSGNGERNVEKGKGKVAKVTLEA